jgi:hypothetical protein
MARREQAVVCPNCKKAGSAIWEGNENPAYQGGELGWELATTLKSVSSGFRLGEGTEIFNTTSNFKVQT